MRNLKTRLTPSLLASSLLTTLLASSSLAQQAAPAPVPAVQQHQKAQPPSPQERCEALKLRLLKDAYDWQIYAQIGDAQMEMNRPREASASYEKAIAIYPITRERGAEMRQAEFLAAQANAEQQRQKIARDAAQKQAQDAEMTSAMQALSMLPGASSTKALMFQQGLSAAATMTQGSSQYSANMAQSEIAGIANPIQQVNYSLPEKQENANLWIKLGKAYDAYGEHERAGTCFEQGSALDPARFDSVYLTGLSLLSMGHASKSLIAANRYLSMMPGNPPPPVCMLLGDSLRILGMPKESKGAYAMALAGLAKNAELKAGDLAALIQLANTQAKTGDYAAAAFTFRRALAADKNQMQALCGLTVCLMSLDDQDALKALLPELQAKAVNFDDFYILARVQDFLGDGSSAKASYAKSVELWDKGAFSKERQPGIVAVARAGAGNPGEAIAILNDRIDREICEPDIYLDFYRLGLAYEKVNDQPRPDLAAEAFRQCLEDNPSYLQASVELKRLTALMAPQATELLKRSNEDFKAGEKGKAALLRAQAWAIMADGEDRDRVLQEVSEILKELPPQSQPLPKEAADSWLKGNSIFASKKGMDDIRKASLEFRRAFIIAPWNQSLLLNLAACHSALDRADLSKKEIALALQYPGGGTQENMAKLFDYERQRTASERGCRDMNPLK